MSSLHAYEKEQKLQTLHIFVPELVKNAAYRLLDSSKSIQRAFQGCQYLAHSTAIFFVSIALRDKKKGANYPSFI